MVYPVPNTGAQATISGVEKSIHSFGTPQSIAHDRGTAFIDTEFVNWTKKLGITYDQEPHIRPGLRVKSRRKTNT